ncbi:holo-ACP synthase [Mucilaginibacter ginsenosidivorax]|uniref:Holo-[acyl-carrier-protein] synthase n=1 Tax=Mucilaginibacter ginsenosidivorax TaxID=862126 RepID=A0A5B8VYM3_9SPHI|nr:holo-ACP synthase [Mucilaginibacter ginsenosidivorax]QEC76710.1 holo-[acyl-carrier-protein] synthase [Mucilaginibacter ginsenosidivorax]
MVAGVGIDMIEIDRVAVKIEKGGGFRELVFSEKEIAYCELKTNKYQHYAARFAAKEAFFKALGTGWLNGTAFNEVEISNNADGKPELTLIGQTGELLREQGPMKISVSLTHLKAIASAVVIIEK